MDDMTTDIPWSTGSEFPWTATVTMETMETITTVAPVITTGKNCSGDDTPFYWGFVTAGIAIVLFGTNFAPVKKFDTGDGMFFQWVMCAAIFVSGVVVQLLRDSPVFHPMIMLGGVIWVSGNVCVVPIVKTIGLGIGFCVWGVTALLSGWATGRFGLFGTEKDVPDRVTMNYVGVALAVSSAFIFALVKSDVNMDSVDHTFTVDVDEESPLLDKDFRRRLNSDAMYTTNNESHDVVIFNRRRSSAGTKKTSNDESDESVIDKLPPASRKPVGLFLSVFSGLMYGQVFTPTFSAMKKYPSYSQNALDYVFATFCGIFLSSTVVFLLYAAFMKNRPKVYPRAILPGFVSGLMWGVATSCWFVANKVLSEAVAFPIVATGPPVVASLLGIFLFKEIKGKRNILIWLLGSSTTISGAVLAGFSKTSSTPSC